ncbi:universal stress protein [Flavobacterium sp.]|jgi:nucleotide-binding universal stress UspA family protein|uniref:universal stress protein n=1 Tax=Flavobacterium sp. TaxID=239 RepID=UPI002A832FF4|nr:universal stress protein [Flavobacterium sp.]
MKKILVPIDFSKHAEYALKVAAQIAKKNDGEVFLLHMLELPSAGGDALSNSHDIPELMLFKNAAVNRMNDAMQASYLDGLKVTKIIQFEMAFEGIIKNGESHGVDLIVMGSHGARGFQEMFIGSNTEKVVRNSNVPVLVIKKEEPNFSADKFVFASDFSEEIKKPFEKVAAFANKFNSHLHLVNINTPNNFKSTRVAEKIMEDFVKDTSAKNFTTHIYNDINVEKGILHFAKSNDVDIIGMCTHGRKGIAHFFNGSISEDLVNHAKRPVITFKI